MFFCICMSLFLIVCVNALFCWYGPSCPMQLNCCVCVYVYRVRRKKDPVIFSALQYFFYKIFRDYSRHNLPLLLQILSFHLSLFRSSTVLYIKKRFFQLRRQINQTTINFRPSGVFWTYDTFEMQKTPVVSHWKQKYQSLSSLDRFTVYIQSARLLRWCKRADTCGSWELIFWSFLPTARPISSEALSSTVLWLRIQTIIYTL